MKTRECLLAASSPEELHLAVRHMALRGSPDWALENARKFVRPDLWPELSRYFDHQGRVLRSTIWDQDDDEEELFAEEWEGREPEKGGESNGVDPLSAGPGFGSEDRTGGSLSGLIANLHLRLGAIWTLGGVALPIVQSEITTADSVLVESNQHQDLRFHCPICNESRDDAPVIYRQTLMCTSCEKFLRG